jgi:hypothetical protein
MFMQRMLILEKVQSFDFVAADLSADLKRKTKNNLPNLVILFPILYGKFFLNNPLFLKKFILIKENIITNLGTLFFVLRLIIMMRP